jgi:excisionase family DNA binding protein
MADALENVIHREVRAAVAEALASWTPPPAATPESAGPRLLTVDAAAEMLSVSTATVRRLIERSGLKTVRCLGSVRIDVRDIDAMIEEAKNG